jgi:hypothetical protein
MLETSKTLLALYQLYMLNYVARNTGELYLFKFILSNAVPILCNGQHWSYILSMRSYAYLDKIAQWFGDQV